LTCLITDIDNQYNLRQIALVPTVLRHGPYRFHFFSNEGDEAPHIHVRGHGKRAKFWLLPLRVAYRGKFAEHELGAIEQIIHEHHDELLQAYLDWH
jgi:hypothetical protein